LKICPPPESCPEPRESALFCCLLCEAARGCSRRLMTWCMSRASSMPAAALDLGVNACPMKSVSLHPMCRRFNVCVCVCVCMYVCIYIYIYKLTDTHVHTAAYTSTSTQTRRYPAQSCSESTSCSSPSCSPRNLPPASASDCSRCSPPRAAAGFPSNGDDNRAYPMCLALALEVDGFLRGRFVLATPLATPALFVAAASVASLPCPGAVASGRAAEKRVRLGVSPRALAAPGVRRLEASSARRRR
jgi:hypothetical protein